MRRRMLDSGKNESANESVTRKFITRTISGEYVNDVTASDTTAILSANELLTALILPNITRISNCTNCTSLAKVDLASASYISGSTFSNNTSLVALILRNETMCTLAYVNAFANTPINSGTGYVYVPNALMEEYKANTNWATFAEQLRAIEDYPDICGG